MKNHIVLICLTTLVLTACQRDHHYCVQGNIANGEGKTVYWEHTALMKTTVLDSCVLKADCSFRFRQPSPEYPDFYRLRIGKQYVILAIDSTETIQVITSADNLNSTESISGSNASIQIAKLRHAAEQVSLDSLRSLAQSVIIADPKSTTAYYALFLRQNGRMIWDIQDPMDRRWFQAVATSYHVWMPAYERSKALYAQISDVLESNRQEREKQRMRDFIDAAENTFLDITLEDENGYLQSLSDLLGQVIVLDFSVTQVENAMTYIFALRELYTKYHNKGLQIYSVSLDPNILAWQDAVRELPWVTVHTEEGFQSPALITYNVQQIPTLFLIDKKGNVQGRFTDFKSLDAAIGRYL